MEGPPSWGDLRPDLGAIPIVKPPPKPAPEPYRGRRARDARIDNEYQTTFNIPSNILGGVNQPSIEQRAMGITYELPGTQGSVLRPKNQVESIRYGYQPYAVSRKNVPFPAVSDNPTFGDVAEHMRAADYAELYGVPYPTPDEIVAAHENLPLGHFPPLLTEDQKAAIRQLAPLAPPEPEPEVADEFARLGSLFS